MSRPVQDARLQEMRFLAKVSREEPLSVAGQGDSFERRMIASLLYDGFLNGVDTTDIDLATTGFAAENNALAFRTKDIKRLLSGSQNAVISLKISHRGRVRLSELEQQLTSGRDRDRFAILLSGRHINVDLTMAIQWASQESPVAVAYLDMNGLKAINDTHGHAAADEVIRSYLGAVAIAVVGFGEGYRVYDGGDEVVVIMRSTNAESASKLMRGLLQQLSKEKVTLPNSTAPTLTASCGIVTTANPDEDGPALLARAEQTMRRAKDPWRTHDPRVSALAIGEEEPALITLSSSP